LSKDRRSRPFRELATVKLGRLTDCMQHSAQLAYPQVSGLSDFLWRVIGWVAENEPVSINELAALLQRDVAQVSRAVKELVAVGLLHRAARKGGPGVLITPTPAGRATYARIRRLAHDRDERMTRGLSSEQLRLLEECIVILSRNAEQELLRQQRREQRASGIAAQSVSRRT
jgi:DNA-binding MarR family transcriptional regulator